MTPEVLAWDDASNNRLLASGRGSWIHNPISAYRTIEGSNKELADKIFVSLSPKGPVTRRSFANCRAYGITEVSAPSGATVRLSPMALLDSAQVRLKRMYPAAHYRATTATVQVPIPRAGGMGAPLVGTVATRTSPSMAS